MAGLVWKSHHGSTVEAARIVDEQTDGIRVLGGLTLNAFVGGLNADAVDAAVALGARVVWLPTIHAAFHAEALGTPGGFDFQDSPLRRTFDGGIRIIDDSGLRTEVHEILELLDGRDVVLGTGHVSPPEIAMLTDEIRASSRRVRVLVNHALFHAPSLDQNTITDLADDFVFFETCHLSTTAITSATTVEQVAETIRQTPRAQWVLATDSGQAKNVAPTDALRAFATSLVDHGVPRETVREMMVARPLRLLGL